MMAQNSDLRISLEPHLLEKLRPLPPLLPDELRTQLLAHIGSNTIPYSLLLAISQWTRRVEGQEAFRSYKPSLDVNDYLMVSLLAGTKTSPEGKFGKYTPPKDPEQVAAERRAERRAIVTLLNAILSVAGAAFAAFWAGLQVGWKMEWRVLLALAVAIIVASSEAILYLIWSSRKASHPRKSSRKLYRLNKKIEDPDNPRLETPAVLPKDEDGSDKLRRRHPPGSEDPNNS